MRPDERGTDEVLFVEDPAGEAPTREQPAGEGPTQERLASEGPTRERPASEANTRVDPAEDPPTDAPARTGPLPVRTAAQATPVAPPGAAEVDVVDARVQVADDLHVEVRAEGNRLDVVVHTTPALVSQYHDLGAELQASLQHGGFDLGAFSARGDRREPASGPVALAQGPARPTRPRAARRGGRYA